MRSRGAEQRLPRTGSCARHTVGFGFTGAKPRAGCNVIRWPGAPACPEASPERGGSPRRRPNLFEDPLVDGGRGRSTRRREPEDEGVGEHRRMGRESLPSRHSTSSCLPLHLRESEANPARRPELERGPCEVRHGNVRPVFAAAAAGYRAEATPRMSPRGMLQLARCQDSATQ